MDQSLDTVPRSQNSPVETAELKKLYRSGRLRVDCIIMQCVDFDHALYNRLLQLHKSVGDIRLKRKQEDMSAPRGNQEKKRRRCSHHNNR